MDAGDSTTQTRGTFLSWSNVSLKGRRAGQFCPLIGACYAVYKSSSTSTWGHSPLHWDNFWGPTLVLALTGSTSSYRLWTFPQDFPFLSAFLLTFSLSPSCDSWHHLIKLESWRIWILVSSLFPFPENSTWNSDSNRIPFNHNVSTHGKLMEMGILN